MKLSVWVEYWKGDKHYASRILSEVTPDELSVMARFGSPWENQVQVKAYDMAPDCTNVRVVITVAED